jgi:hypothetical protein
MVLVFLLMSIVAYPFLRQLVHYTPFSYFLFSRLVNSGLVAEYTSLYRSQNGFHAAPNLTCFRRAVVVQSPNL